MKDRIYEAYECDHLRQVIRLDGLWVHNNYGRLGTVCEAGVYEVVATYSGDHLVGDLRPEGPV